MEDTEVFKRNSSVQEFKPAPNFQEFCFLIIIKNEAAIREQWKYIKKWGDEPCFDEDGGFN